MRVNFRTRVNKFPEMQANLRELNGKKINVGVKGELAW